MKAGVLVMKLLSLSTVRCYFVAWIICFAAMLGCDTPQPNVAGAGGQAPASTAVEAPAQVPPAQKATAAVCKLGAKLRNASESEKLITGAPGVLLDVKVGSVLNITVPNGIQTFQALNGRFPKNHAEFMQQIVEQYNIQLPELVDGMVYQFNPEKGELWAYPANEVPTQAN
jgi:hypothetical protein